MWIDTDYSNARDIGRHFYLARTLDTSTGRERWSLRERPCPVLVSSVRAR